MPIEHKIGLLKVRAECLDGAWGLSISTQKETLRLAVPDADQTEAEAVAGILADMIRSGVAKWKEAYDAL